MPVSVSHVLGCILYVCQGFPRLESDPVDFLERADVGPAASAFVFFAVVSRPPHQCPTLTPVCKNVDLCKSA